MEWKNIYRGMVMGTVDLIPGISGGTIAVLLGFYDRLIAAINGIFSREWKKHLAFLIPLGVGMATAIFTFSRVMNWLLKYYEQPTYYFFLGLIIGILPYLFRESEARTTFKWQHILLLAIGIILIILLPLSPNEGAIIEHKTLSTYILLFFSGFVASAAMILPGISGSFVLVVIGVYKTIMHGVSTFDLKVIIVVGIGIALGILTMSKIIHYFLMHYRTATFALIIGLVIGSIFVIFPGWAHNLSQLVISILVFTIGLFAAYVLGKVEY
ncbi:DUF368 domain-containing protein [Pseudogracilibacillus sp. SO30301A]|uniref:DUF368 domain-containing protein n=1 Tax=Pseudogracilibacillus sp. SO30301A TaxID=3098291 RepID=UPI00300E33F7